ncbi:Mu transposase C-terminal domain-containing protein [Ralstonia sp.]|uniref:Mu transposase C-terminal domain-containing protein n=1 Tax=Ralstonia sp. TaxID=54061 RepID=UPI0031D8AB5F
MGGISKNFFKVEPGQQVRAGDRVYTVTHLMSIDSVLASDVETKESRRLRVDELQPFTVDPQHERERVSEDKDLALFSNEEWAQAQQRFQAIKPLLENPVRTRQDAEKIAQRHGVHVATLYKWLKQYQSAGHVSALVPTKRGRKTGTKLLAVEQERLIESAIEDVYLNKQRHRPQDVIEEVLRRCRLAKMPPPHPNTVRSRLALLQPAETLRRRGFKEMARNKFAPIRGQFPGADYPYSIVQIDHTPADIILVDEAHRKPIGRPWLTLAIDVYSRMVAGIYLTFEKPSATSVGMCLAQAICSKREYLAELDVSGEWSVWGVMSVVHSDNGKEFRSAILERACAEYSIDLQWRPVRLPHYGGHIERLMGTMANEIRKLPGATFSNPTQRKGYDSEKHASLTLKEFERHIVDFIVNVYHQRVHSQIGMAPRRKWELGVLGDEESMGTGVLPIPADPLRIRLDFLPYFERSVQQYGIQIDNISYYDHVLDPYINAPDPDNPKAKRVFLVRRDPRDISKVYFFDPVDSRYVAIPYRDLGHPAMSAWELKEVQQALKAEGRRDVDEYAIFAALERMRTRIEDAKEKTKAARRQAVRAPVAMGAKPTAKRTEPGPEVGAQGDKAAAFSTAEDDPFASPIVPFDEISVAR